MTTTTDPNHWANHLDFYNHPMIMSLSQKPRWTANAQTSDGNRKRPISIDKWRHDKIIMGCTLPDEPDTPSLTTLPEIQSIMSTVNHHVFRLHNPEDGVICLDVEKTCPQDLKDQFLKLPYVYGEISLSGQGYHLFLPYPAELMKEFPIAQTKIQIKGPDNNFEFLIDRHFVTFTRRMLPPANPSIDPDVIMRPLWAAQKRPNKLRDLDPDADIHDIPELDYILRMISISEFRKTLADYDNDNTRYDLALARFYYNKFLNLVTNLTFKKRGYVYTDEDAIIILGKKLNEVRPERNEKKGDRNGVPWLTHQVMYMLSSNDETTEELIQKAWAELDKKK